MAETTKDFKLDSDEDEPLPTPFKSKEKYSITETVSEDEKKWLDTIRGLKISPGECSPGDLQKLLETISARKDESLAKMKLTFDESDHKASGAVPKKSSSEIGHFTPIKKLMDVKLEPLMKFKTPQLQQQNTTGVAVKHEEQHMKNASYSFPKLSSFSGDGNKGEVSWETFKYEIEALMQEYTFTDEQVMLGVRRAVKGTASDIVRRLGTGISIQTVIRKLNSTYGNIECAESVMRKFYSCTQGSDPVSVYAVRLENIYSQAVDLGSISRNETLLKQVLYQGLKMDLKHTAQYKFDTIADYDRFKIDLRKLEADLKLPESKNKTCLAAQKIEDKKDFSHLESTIMELKEKIERLENDRYSDRNAQNFAYEGHRGFRRPSGRFRGNPGRGEYSSRGSGYRLRRPLAGNNFRGSCFRCGNRGHFAKDCDMEQKQYNVSCYRCGEPGHYAKECQADLKRNHLNE